MGQNVNKFTCDFIYSAETVISFSKLMHFFSQNHLLKLLLHFRLND